MIQNGVKMELKFRGFKVSTKITKIKTPRNFQRIRYHPSHKAESAIMRQVVLWNTACNFNAIILNQSIFNCLITSASILYNL